MARTCAICGETESSRHRKMVFEGWILWPSGPVLCPFCRQASANLAGVRQRARDLRLIAARQRRLAAEMVARSADLRQPSGTRRTHAPPDAASSADDI
jgi:hypothetical protein